MFEKIDRPALRPLPTERYHYTERKYARVNIDYHVEFSRHYYSVPYQLAHEQVEVRATDSTIEIFHHHNRVASHRRSNKRGQHTTDPAHMPSAHRRHAEWTPSRIVSWAETVGENTAELTSHILRTRRHPEQVTPEFRHSCRRTVDMPRCGQRFALPACPQLQQRFDQQQQQKGGVESPEGCLAIRQCHGSWSTHTKHR